MTDARKKHLRERHAAKKCRCYAELPKWKVCKYELMSRPTQHGTFRSRAIEAELKRRERKAEREKAV